MAAARGAFLPMSHARKKKAVCAVAPGAGMAGRILENQLPSFWNEKVSKMFGGVAIGRSAPRAIPGGGRAPGSLRKGQKVSRAALVQRAKDLLSQNHSYGEIGEMLGVSKSQAWRLTR